MGRVVVVVLIGLIFVVMRVAGNGGWIAGDRPSAGGWEGVCVCEAGCSGCVGWLDLHGVAGYGEWWLDCGGQTLGWRVCVCEAGCSGCVGWFDLHGIAGYGEWWLDCGGQTLDWRVGGGCACVGGL